MERLCHCSRCDGTHDNVVFSKLTHPIIVDEDKAPFTHWASCPVNGEPIIVSINNVRENEED